MILYHGSLIDIKDDYLKPNKAFQKRQYKEAVYLTISKIIALLHARNPIRLFAKECNSSERCNAFSSYFEVGNEDDVVHIYEYYDGMFDEVLTGGAYLYECEIESTANLEDKYNYKHLGEIKYQNKIYVKNVFEYIKKTKDKIVFHYFNDLTEDEKYFLYDRIGSRANECESDFEVLFFKEKFPNIDDVQNYICLRSVNR